MLKRLTTTTIYVKDQNEALRFYTEKLGFELRQDITEGDYRWLAVGLKGQPDLNCSLEALKAGSVYTQDEVNFLTKLVEAGKIGSHVFITDDCQKTYEDLTSKGVEFTYPPTERPYGVVEAVFKDNSGNVYVLSQPKR